MRGMEWVIIGIIVLLVVILGIYLWSTYNGLVKLNVRVDEAWSDITVQLEAACRPDPQPHRVGEGLRLP